jgi:hypothetical protein
MWSWALREEQPITQLLKKFLTFYGTRRFITVFKTALGRPARSQSLYRPRYPSSFYKVKVTLRLTVSQSVSLGVEPHLGLMTRYLLLFDSYGLEFVGRPLWRNCVLYMLLALASEVFLRSEFLGTCDRILLSQIWDFPFRRLLRLAGSRWRYSTPPPLGWLSSSSCYIWGPQN